MTYVQLIILRVRLEEDRLDHLDALKRDGILSVHTCLGLLEPEGAGNKLLQTYLALLKHLLDAADFLGRRHLGSQQNHVSNQSAPVNVACVLGVNIPDNLVDFSVTEAVPVLRHCRLKALKVGAILDLAVQK